MISLVSSTVLLHSEISLTIVSLGELLMQALMFNRCGFDTRNCAIFRWPFWMASSGQENHTISPIAREIRKGTCLTLWWSLCRLMARLGICRQIDNRVRVLCTSLNRLTVMSASANGEPDHLHHCTPKWISTLFIVSFYNIAIGGQMFQMLLYLWTG